MNRKSFKKRAKEGVAAAGKSPKRVTLLFLLIIVGAELLVELASRLLEGLGGGSSSGYLSASSFMNVSGAMISMGLSFVVQFCLIFLVAGYLSAALDLTGGSPISADYLLDGFRKCGKVAILYLLESLYLGLQASFLLVIPILAISMTGITDELTVYRLLMGSAYLIIWLLSYRYRGAFFALMDDDSLSAGAALRKAKAINRGHRFELFVMDLSFLPLLLLCVCTLGILLIWKLPYIATAYANQFDYMVDDYEARQPKISIFPTR